MKPEDSANLQVGAWAALASRVPGARLGNAGAGGGAADLERDTLDTSVHSHTHTRTHTRPLGHASEPTGSFSSGLSHSFPEALPGHTLAGTLSAHSQLCSPCPLSHSYTLSRTSKLYPSHSHTNASTACHTHSNAYLLLT